MLGALYRAVLVVFSTLLLGVSTAWSAPTIVETGWTMIREITFAAAHSARIHPKDGAIYVGKRTSSGAGLFRLDAFGLETKLASGTDVSGVVIADDGDIFFAEDYAGIIYRVPYQQTGRSTWVSGWHSGDDDPAGMAIAPAGHTGAVLKPGEALVVDRGNNGLDEVWRWSPSLSQGEVQVHKDNGTLIDPVDVAVDKVAIYVVDAAAAVTGAIYTVGAGGILTKLKLGTAIAEPSGISVETATGDLLVSDKATGALLRLKPKTGAVSTVISGFTFPTVA